MLISIVEYAQMHKKDRHTVREKAARGVFQTAKKIGRNWVIDSDEPYPLDGKIKTGKYIGWRKPKSRPSGAKQEG